MTNFYRMLRGARTYSELTDAERIAQIRGGDREVFEHLYLQMFAHLFQFARQLCKSSEIAGDVVQDVFLSVWVRRETIDIHTSVKAYLYSSVRRHIMREQRHRIVVDREANSALSHGLSWGMGESFAEPDAQLEKSLQHAQLVQAIRQLPERQRLALSLWLYHELSSIDIAEALGISDRVARRLVEKAQINLKRILDRHQQA